MAQRSVLSTSARSTHRWKGAVEVVQADGKGVERSHAAPRLPHWGSMPREASGAREDRVYAADRWLLHAKGVVARACMLTSGRVPCNGFCHVSKLRRLRMLLQACDRSGAWRSKSMSGQLKN